MLQEPEGKNVAVDAIRNFDMLKNPLARDVAIVVVIKTIIVIAAAIFVFGPASRPVIDGAAVEALISAPGSR